VGGIEGLADVKNRGRERDHFSHPRGA
jgi:hypothetical protein